MTKFLSIIFATLFSTACWAACGVIVDPYEFDSNDPSAWAWYVLCDTQAGTTVTQRAFAFGWLPTSGLITVHYQGPTNTDRLFATGFETDIPLNGAGGGIMNASWWQGGPPDWQTNRVVTTIAQPGEYLFETVATDGVKYFRSRHRISITAP